MTQIEFIKAHKDILCVIEEITARKNRDYSKESDAFANFELVEKLNIADTESGILVRMCDKMARISNLIHQEGKVTEESCVDTLIDLANYAIIMTVYLKNKEKKNGKKSY